MDKELKILIVSGKHPFGDSQDFSYEWNHFYLGLKDHFERVDFFDFLQPDKNYNRDKIQALISEQIKKIPYDIIIIIPYTDQLEKDFIRSLREHAKILCIFHDDNWRQDFVKELAPHVDIFTTTDPNGVEKYKRMGFEHAVFLPFGINEKLFNLAQNSNKDIDVSFVGAWHPHREWLIKKLKKNGIKVEVFGYRWSNGHVSTNQMIDIFRRSKISLNLSNSISFDARYLLSSPRALINNVRSKKDREQLKGRLFEIPACGAMQISYYVEGLEQVFNIGKEIAIYASLKDLLGKVSFYLRHDDLRGQMIDAAYKRVMEDHCYWKEFVKIFEQLKWC
jgi:spore maturation protein CgeB